MIRIKEIERIAKISASCRQLGVMIPGLVEDIGILFDACPDEQTHPLGLLAAHLSRTFDDDPGLAERSLRLMLEQRWLAPYGLESGDRVCLVSKITEPEDKFFCPFCERFP